MKGNVKRVICLFLAAIIVVTTVGYAPPSFALTAMSNSRMEEALKALASPSEAEEIVEEVATPSEAESPGDKATPSEAEKPGDKASPSEVVRKFIQVEPEEIPEYYSQLKKAGKRFWKFEDRNGFIQYRDYGYVEGEAEFPLWYEADQAGSVEDMSSSVNLDKEYYDLAPYLYKSATPTKTSWSDLSWKLLNDSESIFLFDRKEGGSFKNWDHSTYAIWSVNEKEGDEFQNTDLGYFFYGQILNESDSVEQWYYADLNGNISPMMQVKTMMLMAEAPTTCKLTFDANGGTIYNKQTYEKDVPLNTAVSYTEMDTIKQNMKRVGYSFDGWNYQPDGSGSNFYDSTKVTSDTTIYAKWRKNQYRVTFYGNYPVGDKTSRPYKYVYYGDPIGSFTEPFQVGVGMEFQGYYLNQYGSGEQATPDMLMPGNDLDLYAKWQNFDVTYKMHYGYGIDESTLPSEVKAKSTVIGSDLIKYYFPDLVTSNKLYVPGYTNGNWTDKVATYGILSNWYPTNHVTNIYLEKAPKRVVFDLFYPPYDYPKNKYSSSSYTVSDGYSKYGEVIKPKDLDSIMQWVRSGKKFVSLSYDPEQTKLIDISSPIYPPSKQETGDMMRATIYLAIANESSQIIFKDYDGKILSEKTVNYGDPIEIPQDPEREGYRFTGWDVDVKEDTKFPNDTIITAQYVENGFRINLYANGGKFEDIDPETGTTIKLDTKTIKFEDVSDINDVINKSNEFLTSQFKILKRSGYEPVWYDSASSGNPISSITESDILSGKKDVYAQWKNVYLVKFVNWNGTVLDQQYVKAGSDAILPQKPKRANYIFKKWSSSHLNIQGNKTLTAVFISARASGQKEWYTKRNNPNEADTQSQFEDKQYLGDFGIESFDDQKDYYQNFWQYDDEKIELKELRHEGDIFLGWVPTFRFLYNDVLNPVTNDSQYVKNWKNNPPQLYANYTFQGLRSDRDNRNDRIPGAPILSKNISLPTRSFHQISGLTFYGLWIPENKPSLILINGFDYMGLAPFNSNNKDLFNSSYDIWEDNVPYFESISVADYFGQNIMEKFKKGTDKLGLPVGMRTKDFFGPGANYYENTHVLVGYFSEPDGNGKRLDSTYTFDKVDDRYYAYYVPINEKYHVQFQDESGNIISEMDINAGSAITNPPNAPLKEGYTLLGWYNITDELSTINNIYSNVIFKPRYEQKEKMEVVFKDWNGTTLDTQEVLVGANAIPPAAPQRLGYTFSGWDKPYINIQDHSTITALYTRNSYKLTLNGNGGTLAGEETKDQVFDYGESFDHVLINGKADAARRYYTFTGWYTAPSGGSKYPESGNLMPDAEVTAYAHWERSSSEVIFKDWNGMTLEKQEVAIGANATPPEVPERQGYTFNGWDKSYLNIQDHITITAQYTINGYLLTLDGNGGTLDGNARKEEVLSFNQSFDQALKGGRDLVSRSGYSFDGWYNSASGGSSYSYSGNQMPAANVTLFAHWSPNTYKVTFDPDHVRWDGEATIEEHTFDTRLGILPMPEIYGWKLTGWWTGKNGTGTEVTNDSMVEPKDVVYYGKWQPETYQIRFISKAEQPEGESVQAFTVGLKYDQKFGNLPVPEENGYTFMGWYDEENKKVDSQTIFNPDTDAEAKTYHAGWKGKTYQIRLVYNDSDGKPVVKIIDGTYGIQIGTLPSPEKQGYTFTGWFRDNGEEVTAGSWVEPGDTEYKARWIPNKYTIHFKSNLDSMSDPEDKTVTYALPIGDLPLLHVTGYVFLGWYTESSGGSLIKETTFAALGDQTYYGHWSIGLIDNGNGTYRKPGSDVKWNTADDELWWYGPDGIIDTDDDWQIYLMPGGNGYYVDYGNGTYLRPGAGGSWTSGTELWWYGSNGKPGAGDHPIYLMPGGNGYYVDFGNCSYLRPGAGGSWTSGTELWWYGSNGKPGADDRPIYIMPGGNGYYIDNGNGTYTKSGSDGSWTNGTETWVYGPGGKPGAEDRQIHVMPGGNGYYIDNGNGTYTKPGPDGSWTNGTETWVYGPGGKPGADDRQIHVMPGGNGYYIDNGDGTYTKPGSDGSWTNGTEHWSSGPDGKIGTSDDKKIDSGNVDPEPTNPEPTNPEPANPEPIKPEPEKREEKEIVTAPVIPVIDSTVKPVVPDTGGTFTVNPNNPLEVTYTKPDGTAAKNEWVGDGKDWYHVDESGNLNYDWYLDGERTWYKLNKETGDRFGAALIGWNYEPMDDKRYFFDPSTTKMLTGWQHIDNKWYYFTKQNESQTYYGSNPEGWKYDPTKPGKPYGSMYQNEITPDGYLVDENGVWKNK